MPAEDILDVALQHEAVDKLVAVRQDVPLAGSLIALLPAQEYAACRRHDKPAHRDRILIMHHSQPLRRMERIALRRVIAGSVENNPGPRIERSER